MEKKVFCYICGTKGEKSKMQSEILTKRNKQVKRFYHNECVATKTNEHSKVYSNEKKEHLGTKRIIFELIKNDELILIDQYNQQIDIKGNFASIESPVSSHHDVNIPYCNLSDCKPCVNEYKRSSNFNLKTKQEFHDALKITQYESDIKNCYYQHPCINCPFNHLKYKHVFDIGIGLDGKYIAAIEILNTSKIKKEKILFCIQNDITLIEIKSEDVFKNKNKKSFPCADVWYRNHNNQIEISDLYEDLFKEGEIQ